MSHHYLPRLGQKAAQFSGNFRHSVKAESRKRLVSELPKLPDYAEEKVDFSLIYQWFSKLTRHSSELGISVLMPHAALTPIVLEPDLESLVFIYSFGPSHLILKLTDILFDAATITFIKNSPGTSIRPTIANLIFHEPLNLRYVVHCQE